MSGCTFVIRNVRENDVIDITITDAANCDQKVRIDGLQQKFEWDPIDGDDVTESRSHFFQYTIDSYLEGEDYPTHDPSVSQRTSVRLEMVRKRCGKLRVEMVRKRCGQLRVEMVRTRCGKLRALRGCARGAGGCALFRDRSRPPEQPSL